MNVQTFLVQESIQTRWRLGSSTTYLVFKAANSHSENPLEIFFFDKKPFLHSKSERDLWWLDHGTWKKKWNYSCCFLFLADWKECGQLLLIISGRSLQAGHGYQESKGW